MVLISLSAPVIDTNVLWCYYMQLWWCRQ